jgi:galactokinase
VPGERTRAFAPGRVNLIGEHTDYNQGLALPFAIAEGVTVDARERTPGPDGAERVEAHAVELREYDEFELAAPAPASGWRAFVRGTVAELARAGFPLTPAVLEISGDVPLGAGLSSSAALEVALSLALLGLGAHGVGGVPRTDAQKVELARLCARVESDWVGAQTGLLDQLASLFGAADTALCIDFRSLEVQRVSLGLGAWRLAVLDSGERHSHASSGYNERRAECAAASELLGVASLRDADHEAALSLPEPLRRRALHVLSENERVRETVTALRADDLQAVGGLLNASHASLRDCFEVSTPTVERAVERLLGAGAAGARLMGGGFGGSVLGLFAPGVPLPDGAREVRPGPGAHLTGDR